MAAAKEGIKQKVRGWSHHDSADLYGIDDWGNGYFRINKKGEVTVRLNDEDGGKKDISLCDLLEGLKERGTTVPVLFRFRDLLRSRIAELNDSFRKAIKEADYQGKYQGVYPIKVNQQRQVVEEIAEFGTKYDYGLEAGSKPELIAAMAHMHNPNAYLICNGYKDDEFIDLALTAQKMGLNIFIVLEMPSELDVILERARRMDIRPNLGVRIKLAAKGSGLWQESAGDKSVFGLNAAQVVDVVDKLKQVDALDCLKLLHYHQGSQIPNISVVREGLTEAARIYVDLVKEGAPLGTLDMGGGLAVDYDGSKTNFHSSCNYSIAEFARDVVEVVGDMCTKYEVPHPTLVTESGRAVVAYYSVLVFNVLDVTSAPGEEPPPELPEDAPELLKAFADTDRTWPGRTCRSATMTPAITGTSCAPSFLRERHPAPARAGRGLLLAHPEPHFPHAGGDGNHSGRPPGAFLLHGGLLLRQFLPVPVPAGFLGHPPAFPRDASAPFERTAHEQGRAGGHYL